MAKEYTTLETQHLSPDQTNIDYLHLPTVVHMDDGAKDAMIDFQSIQPLVFQDSTPMTQARRILEDNDIHVGLISNENGQLVGVVSLEQILSRHTVSLIEEYRVERKDVLLKHVMMPLANVAAVNIERLAHAKVGHVVATLQKKQLYYILVCEKAADGKLSVRGVFLASNMSKMLGQHIKIENAEAKSFAELTQKLHK